MIMPTPRTIKAERRVSESGAGKTGALALILVLVLGGMGAAYYYFMTGDDASYPPVQAQQDMAMDPMVPDTDIMDTAAVTPEDLLGQDTVLPDAPPMPGEESAVDMGQGEADLAGFTGTTESENPIGYDDATSGVSSDQLREKGKMLSGRIASMQAQYPNLQQLDVAVLRMMEMDEAFSAKHIDADIYQENLESLERLLDDPALSDDMLKAWNERPLVQSPQSSVSDPSDAADHMLQEDVQAVQDMENAPVLAADSNSGDLVVTDIMSDEPQAAPPPDADMAAAQKLDEVVAAPAAIETPVPTPAPAVEEKAAVMESPSQEQAAMVAKMSAPTPEPVRGGAAAEQAILQNAPQAAPPSGAAAEQPSEPAVIRPLPKEYLVLKKEQSPSNVETRLSTARRALAQNRLQAALTLFTELHETYPHDKRVLMGRALTLQKLGQNGEALSAYEDVLRVDPKNLDALTNMLGLLKVENPELALEKLQQLRDVYPYNPDIAAQLGVAYGAIGDYPSALKFFDLADALGEQSLIVRYNRGVLFDKMGRTSEAAAIYREILSQASDGDPAAAGLPLDALRKRLTEIR